jgi:hypothetical protein
MMGTGFTGKATLFANGGLLQNASPDGPFGPLIDRWSLRVPLSIPQLSHSMRLLSVR